MKTIILTLTILLFSIASYSQSDSTYNWNFTYRGFTVFTSVQQFRFNSNIPQLSHLRMLYSGGGAGFVTGTSRYLLKGTLGAFYTDGSVPYTFNLFEANVSGSVYLLKLEKNACHSFEPYASVSIKGLHVSYFGSYLNDPKEYNGDLLGRTCFAQIYIGTGAEYRLKNDKGDFIHFFAEVQYGTLQVQANTNSAFAKTRPSDPLALNVGMMFGKVRW